MDVECPYCTMMSLEPIIGPDEVYFMNVGGKISELNKVKWRAFRCVTCTRVVVLDEEGIY